MSFDPSVDDSISFGSRLVEETSPEAPATPESELDGNSPVVDNDLAQPVDVDPSALELDPLAADAVGLARAAAVDVGGTDVGDHIGMSSEGAGVVTHVFDATLPGYRGWHWAVTVACAPGTSVVTVDEVVLLPGGEALRAPEWIPWAQRIRPGDLSAGDLLPADPDDHRLVPSFWSDGDPALDDADDQLRVVADEVGLGRVRVLSRDGRVDSAERWVEGDFGPESAMAKQAPAQCGSCGFLVLVRGSLGAAFGICANEYSSADAHVVSVDFGCGAHSEAGVDVVSRSEPTGDVYDSAELVMEPNDIASDDIAAEPVDAELVDAELVDGGLVEAEAIELDAAELDAIELLDLDVAEEL